MRNMKVNDAKVRAILAGLREGHFGVYNTLDENFVLEELSLFEERVADTKRLAVENAELKKEVERLRSSAIFVKGTLYYKGQPIDGYFETSQTDSAVCNLKQIGKLQELEKDLTYYKNKATMLENALMKSGKQTEEVKAEQLTEKEAIEKYGQKIISAYKQEHKLDLLEELMPDFYRLKEDAIVKKHKQEIIDKYKATHADEFLSDERIEQIKVEAVEEYKLSDEYKSTVTMGVPRNNPTVDYSLRLTARFISRLIKGETPVDIINSNPTGKNGKVLEKRSIYRLTTVYSQEDYSRIMRAFDLHKDEFGDITLEQLKLWLDKRLADSMKKAEEKRKRKMLKELMNSDDLDKVEALLNKGVYSEPKEIQDSPAEVDDWGEPIVKEAE